MSDCSFVTGELGILEGVVVMVFFICTLVFGYFMGILRERDNLREIKDD